MFDSLVRKFPWRRKWQPTPVFLGFPCGSAGKKSTCSAGDLGSIHGSGRSSGGGQGSPRQYSWLENAHGQRSLVGYSPRGRKRVGHTERLNNKPQRSEIPKPPSCTPPPTAVGSHRLFCLWVRLCLMDAPLDHTLDSTQKRHHVFVFV